jgi:hypothetical protein
MFDIPQYVPIHLLLSGALMVSYWDFANVVRDIPQVNEDHRQTFGTTIGPLQGKG